MELVSQVGIGWVNICSLQDGSCCVRIPSESYIIEQYSTVTRRAECESKSLTEVLTDECEDSIFCVHFQCVATLLDSYILDRSTLVGFIGPAKACVSFVACLSFHDTYDVGYSFLVTRVLMRL